MQIAYIHGFNSTHRSFNFITRQLPGHDVIVVDYDSHLSLSASIASVVKQLPKKPTALVGHSLGGVIATLIAAQHPKLVSKLVTISSPLGGSKAAGALRWLPGYPRLFHDIAPASYPIRQVANTVLTVPTLSIISTGGDLPTSLDQNDSVVTVTSQRALKFGTKVEVPASHFEVLLHEQTITHLQEFLFEETA